MLRIKILDKIKEMNFKDLNECDLFNGVGTNPRPFFVQMFIISAILFGEWF